MPYDLKVYSYSLHVCSLRKLWVVCCCSVHKAHSCMHMVLMSHFMNPRMVWCFGGETFMGVMRLLGEACNKSCANQGVPSTNLLMRRYVLGLHLLMKDPNLLRWRSAK